MNKKKDSETQPVKSKTLKQKTVAVKSRIKGGPVKRPKAAIKDKTKPKPAPIVDAGYSLYSTTSENSVSSDLDTCSEVLARLKERRKESVQSETNAPFNQRLSSSTPDPEKAVYHTEHGNIFQTVPERDGPVIKETVGQRVQIHPKTSGISIPFGSYESFPNTISNTQFGINGNREIVNTSSSGFIPMVNNYTEADIQGWTNRDSDIQTYQAYIPRESTGFVIETNNQIDSSGSKDDTKGQSSNSSGAKEISQLITSQAGVLSVNSSGTDYVVLPWPKGEARPGIPSGTPIFQLQNGLFQIRPPNFKGQSNTLAHNQIGKERLRTPSPVQHDLGGSYLPADTFQIPERDQGPLLNLDKNNVPVTKLGLPQNTLSTITTKLGLPQDTLSTITCVDSNHHTITPISQGTVSVNTTPRTQSSVNTQSTSNNNENRTEMSSKSRNTEESIPNLLRGKNKVAENINRSHCSQEHNVSTSSTGVHNTQGCSFTGQGQYLQTADIQNPNIQIPSGQSVQGQIFILQASKEGGSSSSSFQLVPVNLVTSSNLNSSGSMPVNQLEKVTPGGQNAIGVQKGLIETNKQKGALQPNAEEKMQTGIPNPWSKVKMDAGLKKLRYLLGELKECGKIGKDVEVGRLVKEVEKTIETIPTLSSKFNLMAEIDLCLQPLRNENCQLRRKLRLASQQVKEKETVKEKAALDFDVLHLQASNTALQTQLAMEKETKVKLALELKELHSQIQRMKIERSKLLAALSEKETAELKVKQECLSDTQKFRHEIEQLQRQTEGIELKHQALEQENHILQITLQQRDTEIDKMQEVVSEVKDCVACLIKELEDSKMGDKSFISNNSYSLQKLVKVLGEDSIASFSMKKPTMYQSNQQYCISKEPSTPRLTRKALETHNKIQTNETMSHTEKAAGSVEEYKASTSDTEVELNVKSYENRRKKSPARRGHSLSPPTKRAPLRERTAAHLNTVSPEQKRYMSPDQKQSRENDHRNRSPSPHYPRNARVAFDFSKNSYQLATADLQGEDESNIPHSCNQSEASRYSVTDYFNKYPKSKPSGMDSSKNRLHQRSYSQPSYNAKLSGYSLSSQSKKMCELTPVSTNNRTEQKELQGLSPQDNLYQGTCLDNSLSAITDDNISSVSERTVSTATTINDTSFRRGIAALDANILKLQLALQKTKSMLS